MLILKIQLLLSRKVTVYEYLMGLLLFFSYGVGLDVLLDHNKSVIKYIDYKTMRNYACH